MPSCALKSDARVDMATKIEQRCRFDGMMRQQEIPYLPRCSHLNGDLAIPMFGDDIVVPGDEHHRRLDPTHPIGKKIPFPIEIAVEQIAQKADGCRMIMVEQSIELFEICLDGSEWNRNPRLSEMGNLSQMDIGDEKHLLFTPEHRPRRMQRKVMVCD